MPGSALGSFGEVTWTWQSGFSKDWKAATPMHAKSFFARSSLFHGRRALKACGRKAEVFVFPKRLLAAGGARWRQRDVTIQGAGDTSSEGVDRTPALCVSRGQASAGNREKNQGNVMECPRWLAGSKADSPHNRIQCTKRSEQMELGSRIRSEPARSWL